MVTIEQKLSVFSKLLERSMNEDFAAQMDALSKNCQKQLQQNKHAVDLEVKRIEKKASREARKERTEMLNSTAVNHRKTIMSAKEELFSIMLEHLRSKVDAFILTKEYKTYLISLAKQLDTSEKPSAGITVSMTRSDLERHGEEVKQAMPHILNEDRSIQVADENIIGGLILTDSKANTRIDLSVRALLEENKPIMMEMFFGALSSTNANKEPKVNE
ncbi:MAG TPA: V-type ATP synthase subunit E family protein [Anaerovoracaceae bacterium]|jgi:vacuolar-type H+-ATPase subunit E/Vma4|nr:V-type ATP synthase subunit E family protein [Eubacteriales bacterium]HPF19106.1 V-type ATP synthase subunit E family protein [Bacillota bacterium]HRV32934.1 V-type ATP synthase subunit E family protein [Anaerovoracaceae bacterium]